MAYAGQDPKVISVFEIVASYFVDCYFNHIWHSARVNLAGGTSLTDEYVRRIQAFITGAKNDPRCYSEVIKGVHSYFTGTTRFTALSFADFVDRIVGVCVPAEYFRQFSAQDKDELLSSVICDLVSNLAAGATKPDMLRRIIDNHAVAPEVTVRMLQDIAVGALVAKRASLHNKFLHKMGQARDSVPLDVVEDMKKALRRLVREKAEAVERAEAAEERAEGLRDDLRRAKQREAKLRELIALIRAGATGGAAAATCRRRCEDEHADDGGDGERSEEASARHLSSFVVRGFLYFACSLLNATAGGDGGKKCEIFGVRGPFICFRFPDRCARGSLL